MASMGDMLKLMQGGTDRTGFADMADTYAFERPDRSAEERLALLKASMEAGQDSEIGGEEDGETGGFSFNDIFSSADDSINNVLTEKGQEIYSSIKDSVGGMYSSFMEDPNPFKVDDLSVPIDADGDDQISEYEQALSDLGNEEKMMDIRNSLYYNYVEPVKDKFSDMYNSEAGQFTRDAFSTPFLMAKDKYIDPYFKSDGDPLTFKADGGRVEMFRGGSMRDSGMVRGSKGYGPAGAGGQAQGPRGNQGGNQGGNRGGNGRQIQTGPSLNNINPEKKRFVQEAVMAEDMNNLMQPRPKYTAPLKEETIMDKLNRINFFEGEYGDPDDGLSFGYDINPFDETANANLTYSFADGGRVAMQQGGMSMPALLGVSSGSSGNLFNNYMPNPSAVPGPSYETLPMPNMPQYTQSMPMQDFNFGDYLGGPDPYAVTYDPYVSATGTGAYDDYGLGMTQEDIDKVFVDLDKFTLAKQKEKAAAATGSKIKKDRGNDRQDAERQRQILADARHRHRNSDNRVDGTNVGTSASVDRANTGRTDGGFGL